MSAIIVKSFVGQAEAYFEKELTNERETYYSEQGTRAGQWTGKGAEALGLQGEIKKEDFSQMSRGVNPNTGERFRRMTIGRTREVNGEITRVKEIAGWDMVISAPKTVSIVGLIGGDDRVRVAHEESVTVALERAEQQAQANTGGGKKEQTGNLVVARFQHDSARPSKDSFVAPQLHDHCFLMNATQREDGSWKPLESLELHRAQGYIKSVYYTELADRLQKLGYAIEIEKETGAPEIAGISKEYRAACSPRRAEILELAEKAGKNFRQLGLVNRREKIFDKDLIQEQHKGIDGIFDYQAARLVEATKENPKLIEVNPLKAQEAVTFALAKLSERDSVFNPRVVLLEANKRGIGQTSVAAIEAELETRKKDGQVKTVTLRDGREAAFLSSDEKIENELPNHIRAVQPQQTLLSEILKTEIPDSVKADDEIEFRKLSGEQQKAVGDIMRATTGVTTLEGRAGVGKTTTLSFVNKMAEKADYEVLGLAPTTGAAQELDNAKITSSTLQKLLATQDAPRDHKRFFIVDESSFVSSRQMDKFFRESVKTGDRVLLVGDTRQHEGIEAGKPFARIQRDELTSGAKVETIRRQTKETDRETVKKLSEGKIVEAVSEMRERGQVREIKDRAERHSLIVEAFIGESAKSMVVAPRNADRQEINSKIHTALKDAGKVGKEETEIKILRPRNDISGVEREFAAAYREGDVITYTRGSAENKIPAKSLAKVVKTNREENLLTVEIKDGRDSAEAREVTYNPKRLRGVSVWTEETIKVSEGDRLQFRAPFEENKTKIANGTICEVGKITPEAINLTTDKGKAVKLDADQPHAIDYGYAVTSHSSQGKTIDRVLIHAETTESKQILNERMAYVAVSRARDEALIFTDDAEKLAFKMARQVEKSEILQTKTETLEYAPERAAKIVLDTKPEFEKADRSEVRQPVILPAVEKLPTPAIEIQPTQQKSISLDAKPEVARAEREENEIQPARKENLVLNAKPEVERSEIKPPVILPTVEKQPTPRTEIEPTREKTIAFDAKPEVKTAERSEIRQPAISPEVPSLPTPEIKAQPQQQKTAESAIDAKNRREILVGEVLQITRDILAKQGIEPSGEAWRRYADDITGDPSNQKAYHGQVSHLIGIQRKMPESERVNPEGLTTLEATHLTLKLSSEGFQKDFVAGRLKNYERQIEAEREEIKQSIQPIAEKLPTLEVRTQQPETKAPVLDEAKIQRERLTNEVFEMTRASLTKQGIKPSAEAWTRFANAVTNDFPNQEATENQQRIVDSIQNIAPSSKPGSLAGRTRLEASYIILKLAPGDRRDAIVKSSLVKYEKQIAAERTAVVKPEVKETVKTTFGEKAGDEQTKSKPVIRDFAAMSKEDLLGELVGMANKAVKELSGDVMPYKFQKRLMKYYRLTGDREPNDKALEKINSLQERFSEPLPQPKNILEERILRLDNSTEAEKTTILKSVIETINNSITHDQSREPVSIFGSREAQPYFLTEAYRFNNEREHFRLMAEANERNIIPLRGGQNETQNQIQQMQNADFLQQQIKDSLDEQGIKLQPAAQSIINYTVDKWTSQPPTAEELGKVQEINRSTAANVNPTNKVEAVIYIAHHDEESRDKLSYELSSAATERAEQNQVKAEKLKLEQSLKPKRQKSYEDLELGRSM